LTPHAACTCIGGMGPTSCQLFENGTPTRGAAAGPIDGCECQDGFLTYSDATDYYDETCTTCASLGNDVVCWSN
jgi:hypothetical protein